MKFEKKFFILSFLTFFTLQLTFVITINYLFYKENKHLIKDNIKQYLELCSYKLNCKDTQIDFIKKQKNIKILTLFQNKNDFFMFFEIRNFKKYYLKLTLQKNKYDKQIHSIKSLTLSKLYIEIVIIIFLSIIFTMILLYPLKKAYKINETFIKDILHDFNTPLSTLKLNLYLLKKEIKNERISKIEHNIKSILNYQNNLKLYLKKIPNQQTKINIQKIIDEKLQFYSISYPSITYENRCNLSIYTNKFLFESIIDNLISNAFKYNKKFGTIKIYCKNNTIFIQDSGKGIKDTSKIFNRFYKENERGIGIGMNIVQKFAKQLNIKIEIISNNGTLIKLTLP